MSMESPSSWTTSAALPHALVELMPSALDILDKQYRLEGCLRFVKTGLMPIDARVATAWRIMPGVTT